MKKRVLSLFLALTLCLTLLPTAVFAEGENSGIGSSATTTVEDGQTTAAGAPVEDGNSSNAGAAGEGNDQPADPESVNEGNGQSTNTGEGEQPNSETDTRTEIWCTSKPDSIGRSYDGTADGSTIPLSMTFTDGTDTFTLKEGTGFTATKTFDSADAGDHKVTVEIKLIDETAKQYKLRADEEKFEINGYINKAYPKLNVSLSRTTCTVGEKILPLLSVVGAPEDAEVTYYYLASAYKSWAGSSDVEGSDAMPKIDENTAISEPGTYYVYAKTGKTKNYEEERSATVELKVNEAVVEAASVTKADGTVGTYKTLPEALNAAQDGDTVKLLANHTTEWDAIDKEENPDYSTLAVVKKNLTLDLNGKSVDYLMVGELTYGEPRYDEEENETVDVAIAPGELTIIQGETSTPGSVDVIAFMSGKLTVQGGIINDKIECAQRSDAENITSETKYGGEINITGGTVRSLYVKENTNVTVTGGTGHAGNWLNDSGTLKIQGGKFDSVNFLNNGGTIAVSGGEFGTITNSDASSSIPLMPLLANGYAFYKDNAVQDATAETMTDVTVSAHTHVPDEHGKCACGASIIASVKTADGTERTYGSFTDALAAAVESNGSTLQLLYDVDLGAANDGLSVDSGKFTLDLNGKTLSGEVYRKLLTINGTADITIKNGKLVNTFSKNSSVMNRGLANAVQINGGAMALEDIEVTSGRGEDGAYTDAVEVDDGSLTVTSGTFTGAITVMSESSDVHPTLKIKTATLHNGITYLTKNTSQPDYDVVKAFFADGSLLFDKDGKYIDITKAEYWESGSTEEYSISVFQYGEESIVKPHTHTIVNGKCSVCGEVAGDGCIAHAVWSPWADDPNWRTTHITTMDELREKITSPSTYWKDYDNNATVTFLCDVTVDKTFLIDNYYTNIIIDLNGHTLSGDLDDPIITANFVSGPATIVFKNGKIVNTGNGEAIRLAKGRVTLENVDVTGDLSLTPEFVNSRSYIPTFLGGGSFTKICTVNDAGGWQKVLEDMLPKGYYFADITSGKRVSQTVLKADSPLENVTVKPCNHKDADGKSTFTYKPERQTYYYCSICGNICPHEHRTKLADGKLHCEDCNLTLTAARRDSKNTITYYIDMSDAFGNAYQPIIWPLCDQTCTQAAMTYYGSKTIDLNGFTVTASDPSGVLFAPYVRDYKMTLQNSAVNQGRYECKYLQVYSGGTLAIPAENNNLTISAVLIESDGNANLAGGSFGKISVKGEKTLAGLLVSGYYFADTASGEPAAMYDADGNALTELTNVTVKPCSHDTAVCDANGVWKCLCGQNVFVASVTKDGTPTYYTDLQNAFSAADGNTVKLMANVRDVTVSTDKPFTFDLNGYNVYSLTVNNKITIKDSATVKGKITEWLEVPSGMTVGELLEDGYAFKKSSGMWCSEAEQAGQAVGNVSIWPVPIRSVTAANPSVTVAYGQTSGVTLTATVVPFAEGGTYTCQWYKIGGTVSPLDGATDSTYQLPVDLAAGTYTYRLTATEDGYEKSCDFTVTVTPVSIEGAAVNVQSLTYNGNAQNPTATVSLGETVLTENRDYTVTATPQTDVGSYMLTVTGKGNYTGKIENVNWKIEPMQLYRFCNIDPVTKTYDGTAAAPIAKSALTFRTTGAVVTLPEDAYDITNARFTMRQGDGTYADSPEAGNGKSLSFTVTLKSGNYVFKGGTADVMDCDYTTNKVDMFTIMQDTISLSGIQFTQYVFNDLAKTYEIELKPLLDDILSQQQQHAGREYGDIKYGKPSVFMDSDYYPAGGATIGNGKLSLSINKAASSKQGDEIGTVAVEVETTNYQPFTLTIHVIAQDKLVPVLAEGNTVSATDITYGQKLANSTLTATGSMICPRTKKVIPGTFAWTNKDFKPDASDSYEAEWTFTPAAGYEEYAPATGTVTIKVNKATPTFTAPTAQENLTYTGQEQALITAGMTDYGTMQYSLTENGTYSQDIPTGTDAGTYTVWYRVIGDENHNDTAPASVAVRIGQKPLTITGVTAATKLYDGTTNADISSVTFDNVTLNRGTDYNVTASFDDASVGNGKNITATVTLMGKAANNYALEQSNFLATGSITKAAAPGSGLCPAVTVINDLAKTYEMVLSNDYLPKLSSPCEYGNVSYSLRGTYLTGGYKDTVQVKVMEENGQYKLKLTVPAVDYNRVSSVGTIDVSVTSDNYQDFYLTIGVKTKNKDVPVPDGTISASNITYGQALNDSKITGKMKDDGKTIDGTFAWKNGAINPDAGSYDAEWVFTPAEGYEEYATVTGTAPVTVNRKAVTVSGITAKDKVYDGNTNATLDFSNAKFDGILENDKLTVTAKGVFEKTEAGKWNVAISDLTLGGNSVANYVLAESGNQTETKATITAKKVTVTITPNGGTYGSVTAAAAVLSGVVDGETVPVTLTYTGNGYNSTSVPTDVDSYTVTASIADNNYILTGETTANFVITPKTVIVSGITAKDKAYDGTTNATLDFSNAKFDGILENDKLTVTAKGVFEKTEAGKRKVAISDLTLGGNSVANYVLAESGNQTKTTATITAKQITVSITPNGGTYGETITPATVKANDVVGEDTPTITLTYTGTANDGTAYADTTPPAKAGTYTVTATTTNPNYTLDPDTNTAEFAIAKRPATVTPDNKSKVYEEKDPELTYNVRGVLDGETLKGITLTRAEGENAGEYAITATADAGANPNYDVTFAEGTLTIEPKSIKGAKVVLGKGLTANGAEQTQTVEKVLLDGKELPADSYTVAGNTATAPGSHTLTITAKGNYTDSVKQTYVIAPAKAEDAPGEEITIDSGKVKVDVKSEGTVPPAALLTDKAELLAMLVDSGDITADELAQIAAGANVDIVLTVKEANVPDEVKTAMAQAAKDYTIGQYLDISLFKYMTVNGSQQAGVALRTTKNALTVSVVVPDALINTNSAVNRTYCIVRNHEGTITVLDAAFDAASKTLTFKTDRFSIYAIAYKDTAVPSSGSNPGSNNSSNDSETKKNEVAAPTPAPTPASTSKPSTITTMPQTGDTSNPTLYVVLLVASLLGLAVVFVCKKRNDK